MERVPIARLVPIGGGHAIMDKLVAEGRVVAPGRRGPIPLPPVLGDPLVDVAAELARSRDDERW